MRPTTRRILSASQASERRTPTSPPATPKTSFKAIHPARATIPTVNTVRMSVQRTVRGEISPSTSIPGGESFAVGERMYVFVVPRVHFASGPVELFHLPRRRADERRARHALLDGRHGDARPERLPEQEHVARLRFGVGQDAARIDEPGDCE